MKSLSKFVRLETRRRRALISFFMLSIPVRLMARFGSVDCARGVAQNLATLFCEPFRGAVDPGAEIAWAVGAQRRGLGFEASCVSESIVSEGLARAAGLPAHIVFGFRRDEFGKLVGHAWAQSGPDPLGSQAEAEPFSMIISVGTQPGANQESRRAR